MLLVSDIMNRNFDSLNPDDPIMKAVYLFQKTKLNFLPVVDEQTKLVGLFTLSVLWGILTKNECNLNDKVKEFMIKDVLFIYGETSFDELIEIVRGSKVGGTVVVNREKRVIGILTKVDMVIALLKQLEVFNSEISAIINSMNNGLIAVNQDGQIIKINSAMEKLLSLKAEKILGRNIDSVFPNLEISGIIGNNKKRIIDQKWLNRDRNLLVNASPILNNGGKVLGAVFIFQDITDLENIINELDTVKEVKRTLETVLEVAYDGIIVINKEGKIKLLNHTMANILNMPLEKTIGLPINNVLPVCGLQDVLNTGLPQLNDIQTINGNNFIVSKIAIIQGRNVIGVVIKVVLLNKNDIQSILDRLDKLEKNVAQYQEKERFEKINIARYTFKNIITKNENMKILLNEARIASSKDLTVLIQGETGTGKELLASAIHNASLRRNGPFVKVNCASIPESLLESELFGYEDGAFTGAKKGGKPGKFELSNHGTIFLDEVGEMPLSLQTKILSFLEDKTLERVGGTNSKTLDLRIIAATNRDLREAIRQGIFRADLYYRLNVISFVIPPLRERKDDLPLLVSHFIDKCNKILGTKISGITNDALFVLYSYDWPGNVRELEHLIERIAIMVHYGDIKSEHLSLYMEGRYSIKKEEELMKEQKNDLNLNCNCIGPLKLKAKEMEKEVILKALEATRGNKSNAARVLGLSRSHLYKKMKKIGLNY